MPAAAARDVTARKVAKRHANGESLIYTLERRETGGGDRGRTADLHRYAAVPQTDLDSVVAGICHDR